MEKRVLQVTVRECVGKSVSRRLRAQGLVPGIFYGPHLEAAVPVSLGRKDLVRAIAAGGNVLFTLNASGPAAEKLHERVALIRQEQTHPVSELPLHVDLFEVRMDEEVKVNVTVTLNGKPKGVVEGGILQQSLRELEVKCLPTHIPDKLEVDVSDLAVGESLHVSDVAFPEGVKPAGEVDYTVAAVVPPEAEPTTEAAAAVPGAEGVVPEEGAAVAEGKAPADAASSEEKKPASE